jgi:predicted TIM-barrel fold metal-dependent hydrolase
VDTSSALFALTPERAAEIIRGYNVDRVVFGSDFPMWSPVSEMQRFNRLPLTDEEREKILWTNHLKLFGL